jgi:hypothetical protein
MFFRNNKDARSLYILGSNVVSPERFENVPAIVVGLPEMDKPKVTDAADLAQYQALVGANVEKLTTSYYEFLPKWGVHTTAPG